MRLQVESKTDSRTRQGHGVGVCRQGRQHCPWSCHEYGKTPPRFDRPGCEITQGALTPISSTGGRLWESFGGDPFLTGESAYETILGMQQSGVQACAKHWVNNEQEYAREQSTSQVDDRTQHEVYAHPFLRSVMAGVATIMCSYSK
jgi:hypothetical protein